MEKIDLKGSLTEQNLLKAFAGESQAAARYRMYAKQARKDGFEKVACFFDETVHNELRHGKIYFEFLQGGMVEITIGDKVLILTDGVNLRYLAPGSKLPAKHQLLIAFEDESCLVASVRMYGGLMCYDKDAANGVLSNYYLEKPQITKRKYPGIFQPGIFPRTYQCRQRTEEIRQSFPCHRTDDSRTRQRCFAGYPLPYTYPPEEKNKRTDRQRARKFVLSDKRDDE